MTKVANQAGPDDAWLEAYRKPSRSRRESLAYDGVSSTLKGFALIVAIVAVVAGIAVASTAPSYGYGIPSGSQTWLGVAVGFSGLATALFMYVAGHAIGLLADAAHSLRAMRAQLDQPAPETPAAEGG